MFINLFLFAWFHLLKPGGSGTVLILPSSIPARSGENSFQEGERRKRFHLVIPSSTRNLNCVSVCLLCWNFFLFENSATFSSPLSDNQSRDILRRRSRCLLNFSTKRRKVLKIYFVSSTDVRTRRNKVGEGGNQSADGFCSRQQINHRFSVSQDFRSLFFYLSQFSSSLFS